jgi:putative transcriptional regulator
MSPGSGQGIARRRILISPPSTGDGNFDRTVVYVIEHQDEGALGVVLNRPTDTSVPEQVSFGVPGATPAVVFNGGPVGQGSFLVLGSRKAGENLIGLRALSPTVALLAPEAVETGEVTGVDRLRVYDGHAGWGAGQLDSELNRGMWEVVDAQHDDVFCLRPERLWRSILSRQGGRLAAMSRFPADPSWN